MATAHPLIRTRLSAMMFLEYFIWGAWAVPFAGYMLSILDFPGSRMSWVMLTTAIGAMVSPVFIGVVADRFFSTEKVLGVLHLLGSICLFFAARQTDFGALFVLMLLNGLFYMPTLALTNSLAFRNIRDSEKDFPIIRVWGTLGWVAAGWLVGLLLGQKESYFLYLAAGGAFVMALYCFTLPHTPPKRDERAARDPLGFRALRMFKQPSFVVFAISAFLVCITLSAYWVGANPYLVDTDRPAPAALMSLGQISEIFFMATMPLFIGWLGLKRVLLVGIAAWVVRYGCFASLKLPLVLIGLLLHGICYDFFFVAAYIYVDKKAPRDLRASAQSLIAFVMLGVGMFVGMRASGWLVDQYPSKIKVEAVVMAEKEKGPKQVSLPKWPTSEPYTGAGALRYLSPDVVRGALFGEKEEEVTSLAERLGSEEENRITLSQLEKLPEEEIVLGEEDKKKKYRKEDLVEAFRKVDQKAGNGDGVVTRKEWLSAKSHQWPKIWLWPLGLALFTALFFGFLFKDPVQNETE